MHDLKILITYFSNTGNTEKVANSLKEGFEGNDVDVKTIKDADPSSLKSHDLVCLGSGIYGGKINREVQNFVKKITEFPQNFAFFCTHSSPQHYQNSFKRIRSTIEEKGSRYLGIWDCMAENLGIPIETQLGMLEKLPDEKRKEQEEYMEKLKGRPNAEDLENAKKFAQSLLNEL